MRVLKICGIILALAALFCCLGIVGRMETEDRQYVMGEISADEMTSGETLATWFCITGCAAVCGGALWTIGSYIEAEKANRELKKRYRYKERLEKWKKRQ